MDNQDILSDVFSTLRIRSELYFRAELRGNFSIELPPKRRRIRFHMVRQGQCWMTMPGGEQTKLCEGETAIVPNGSGQVLSAELNAQPVPLSEILEAGALRQGVLRYGSGSRQTRLLCGFCQFDEAVDHPVLSNLPELLVIRPTDLGGEPWTAATLRLLSMEADLNEQGTAGILARLLEVLFIQAVRWMTQGLGESATGFIAALADAQLSRALQAIHREPHVAWKIRDLAKLAGMSRARFADRFAAVVGVPPIAYLTAWRLMMARALLVNTDLDMAEIASRCGYASVPSFSNRFTRSFNIGPGKFRRSSRSV